MSQLIYPGQIQITSVKDKINIVLKQHQSPSIVKHKSRAKSSMILFLLKLVTCMYNNISLDHISNQFDNKIKNRQSVINMMFPPHLQIFGLLIFLCVEYKSQCIRLYPTHPRLKDNNTRIYYKNRRNLTTEVLDYLFTILKF